MCCLPSLANTASILNFPLQLVLRMKERFVNEFYMTNNLRSSRDSQDARVHGKTKWYPLLQKMTGKESKDTFVKIRSLA